MSDAKPISEICRRVDEFSAWIDASIALGLTGWTHEHLTLGKSHESRLREAGLDQLARSLDALLSAPPSDRTGPFGRLLVIHDITRERVWLDEPWSVEEK
ncbi:hypothetical protein K2X85_09930 [bacterium]|nr:hypothetical protein [bacterium]